MCDCVIDTKDFCGWVQITVLDCHTIRWLDLSQNSTICHWRWRIYLLVWGSPLWVTLSVDHAELHRFLVQMPSQEAKRMHLIFGFGWAIHNFKLNMLLVNWSWDGACHGEVHVEQKLPTWVIIDANAQMTIRILASLENFINCNCIYFLTIFYQKIICILDTSCAVGWHKGHSFILQVLHKLCKTFNLLECNDALRGVILLARVLQCNHEISKKQKVHRECCVIAHFFSKLWCFVASNNYCLIQILLGSLSAHNSLECHTVCVLKRMHHNLQVPKNPASHSTLWMHCKFGVWNCTPLQYQNSLFQTTCKNYCESALQLQGKIAVECGQGLIPL